MGTQTSAFCCASAPAGYVPTPMQLASAESLKQEHIDMWSQDMGRWVECPQVTSVVTCGGSTQPPLDYLADTQNGTIVLEDWDVGPFWVEDPEDEDEGCVDKKLHG
eukprot:CAMPEP_0179057434 /NCGR_PEP_ID=MMETSP0796-20121207/24333_1 /TAXON_ID=73915 /ORGANISM="Pyrodinium bahamense, Strain pbaha01" /LENGTH=105 /DNA_ID=CAMNT_0020754155 /DNA_START=163 /DNA_END=480 /DNA_ORIENTATION=+